MRLPGLAGREEAFSPSAKQNLRIGKIPVDGMGSYSSGSRPFNPSRGAGRDRHRHVGSNAVAATASGRERRCRAGDREQSHRADDTALTASLRQASAASTREPPKDRQGRARTAKSCGPDARIRRQALAVRRSVQPDRRLSDRQGDGGNRARLPGESAKDAVNPSRREGRASGPPVVHPVCISCARTRVPAGARPSLRPLGLSRAG
jgi:hypothetical protein